MASREPMVSELRIILMGDNSSETSRVGNFILGRDAFDTEAPPPSVEQHCERAGGTVEGRYITIINTPHQLHPHLSLRQITEQINECLYICAPEPHVFLLVLRSRTSKQDLHRIKTNLDSYSPWIMKYTIVLTTDEDYAASQDQEGSSPSLHVIFGKSVADCKVQALKLLETIERVVRDNEGRYLTYDTNKLLKGKKRMKLKCVKHVPMVLLGKNSSETSRVGNFILGRNAFDTEAPPPSVEQHCERAGGRVEGRYITIINTPHLFNPHLTLDQIIEQIDKCMTLCSPPHTFLFVLQSDGCTVGEWEQMRSILKKFSDTALKHTTVTTQKQDIGMDPHKLNQLVEEIKKCGGQHYQLDTDTDRSKLINAVDQTMKKNRKGSMKLKVREESILRKNWRRHSKRSQKEMPGEVIHLKPSAVPDPKAYFPRDIRIIMLGKTAAGKSATGNTIVGREDLFKEGVSGKTVTTVCQKETAEINGRQITVIDTPGLFDPDMLADHSRNVISKSITMVAPGPHVILLVVPIERYNQDTNKTTNMILNALDENSRTYTMVLFTKGDDLKGKSIEEFIENSGQDTKDLIKRCEDRFHVFNNRNHNDRTQVTALLEKIDSMMAVNNGRCYTNEIFQKLEREQQDREEEQRLRYQRTVQKDGPEKIKHKDEETEILVENFEKQKHQQWLWYQRHVLKRDVQPDDAEKIRGEDGASGGSNNILEV